MNEDQRKAGAIRTYAYLKNVDRAIQGTFFGLPDTTSQLTTVLSVDKL